MVAMFAGFQARKYRAWELVDNNLRALGSAVSYFGGAEPRNLNPVLDVHGSEVSAGISHLNGLANLRYLNLSYTAVDDASIESLSIPTLKILDVRNTRVSEVGVARLKNRCGNCRVLTGDANLGGL